MSGIIRFKDASQIIFTSIKSYAVIIIRKQIPYQIKYLI